MNKIPIQDVETIRNYYDNGFSIQDIANTYGVTYAPMQRYFKRHGIIARSLPEARAISKKAGLGLIQWQKLNGSWYRGKNKSDPKIAAIIEKGRQTQVKNGKNKGKNNPMYGKTPPHSLGGFRKDLGHFLRSGWEANFARILNSLGLTYEYEKSKFTLKDGRTYTPDFYIPSKNKYYEIKGWEANDKIDKFKEEFRNIKIWVIKKPQYSRLIKIFSKRISLENGSDFYNWQELKNMFLNYCLHNKASVSKFCKENQVPRGIIKNIFGSFGNLLKEYTNHHLKNGSMGKKVYIRNK